MWCSAKPSVWPMLAHWILCLSTQLAACGFTSSFENFIFHFVQAEGSKGRGKNKPFIGLFGPRPQWITRTSTMKTTQLAHTSLTKCTHLCAGKYSNHLSAISEPRIPGQMLVHALSSPNAWHQWWTNCHNQNASRPSRALARAIKGALNYQ